MKTVYSICKTSECSAGDTCSNHDFVVLTLYETKELARKYLKTLAETFKGGYWDDEDSYTLYFDVCTCDLSDDEVKPCTYQEYLKANDWSGFCRYYIHDWNVREENDKNGEEDNLWLSYKV